MDKWRFMNLSSMRFDLDGVKVNTRPVINEFIRHWLKVRAGEMCKDLGYSITLKRVIVHAV